MPWIEQAQLLLRKAKQDAAAVEHFVDEPDIVDEIAGFHTQQACEKAVKAVLAANGVEYRRTHNLRELLSLVTGSDIDVPEAVTEVVEWTPFAAFFRYEDWEASEPMDRSKAVMAVESTIRWAESIVPTEEAPSGPAHTTSD